MPSKSSTPVALRFPNDVILQLDALAASRGYSRPEAVRLAVNAGLGVLGQSAPQEPSPAPAKRRSTKAGLEQAATPAVASAGPPPAKPPSLKTSSAAKSARGKKDRAKPTPGQAPPQAESELVTFAAQVIESGQRTKTGRFGEDRLFINHLWRQYKREHKPKEMDLEGFKKRLVEANRGRYLSLVCADMAPSLNQKDVKESEIRHLSATFHFLCL